jgi:CPA1 family monovalent cation:H+ antiporter
MQFELQTGILLLLVASVVAMLTKRLHLPYSAGLVATGIALTLLPFAPQINVNHDLIYTGLLPPLLFEASYEIHWDRLRRNALVVGVLATLGVLLSGAATAAGMHYVISWPWMSALVFGALIAATDPVSVIATFREAKAHGRLLLLIEAESLLNDGTAAVAFGIVLAFATGGHPGPQGVALAIIKSIGGGAACGAIVGIASLLLIGSTNDHLIEITCTTVAAWGSFLLAISLGVSGVLATITAGLVMRNYKRLHRISQRGKEAIEQFWEYAAFIANSFVFLLIGAEQSRHNLFRGWVFTLLGILVVLVARAVAVFPCCALFIKSELRVSPGHQVALFWGGLRGALALALVLSLPRTLPFHDQIVTISFAVVAFSIFVQGLTMAPLLRWIGEIPSKTGKNESEAEPVHTGAGSQ